MAYTTIDKPSDYFNTILYTGDNSTNAKTGVGFQPDFVWCKSRSDAIAPYLWDVVRGTDKNLRSDDTYTEVAVSAASNGIISTSSSDGFISKTGSSSMNNINGTSKTYAAWNWKAGGTAVSNTDGSITSSISANQDSGFSIVSWTGNGTDATIGHGLSSAPKLIMHKHRSGTVQWNVYADSPDAGTGGYLRLDSSNAWAANSGFFGTAPTATVFSPGSHSYMSGSGNDNIAYCFSNVKGYQKIGYYDGNSSLDGTFVYTGFKPAWIVVKTVNGGTGAWYTVDNKRDSFNVSGKWLDLNTADIENTTSADLQVDFLSNGFKNRTLNNSRNGSGISYIYLAFAENPFVTSTGIPATAR